MVEYKIEGITVHFPYEAYPCQIKYMERVISCLNRGWNGALESPTGTGKTLCLLCSCLAWQQNQKRILLEQAMPEKLTFDSPAMIPSTGVKTNQCVSYPKILYTSRTHLQLSQVIRELNKTVYKAVKTSLLGSRDQLCIHDDVRNEENTSIKNHMCRAKVKSRSCHFYNGFDAYQNGSNNKAEQREKGSALDLEDFISFGRRNSICPFYASRDKPDEADLILMPYNYVVDPKARKANKIDLHNVIVIFDEGHNLAKVCEDSGSITFATKDVAASMREAKEALNMLLIDEEALRREMDETKLAFGAMANDDVPQANIDPKEVGNLILLLENLEKEIDKIDMQRRTDDRSQSLPGSTFPGDFLLDLLQSAGILAYLRDDICNLIDKVTSYLTTKATNNIWQSKGVALQRFSSFLNTVYSEDEETSDAASQMDAYRRHCRNFKVYVCPMEDEKRKSTTLQNFVKDPSRRQGLQFNYWCFSAALTMQSLERKGVYSMLVTSGTLSPLNQFTAEMGIPFQITLINDHVVQFNQSSFGVICKGPDGVSLDASYANRQNDSYVSSLGNTLVNIFRLVPEGCLVFFASYSQMSACMERWKNSNVWNRMAKHKTLYVEPRSKEEFYRTIGEYNNVVKTRPAAFFAVCRGKVSEGIDFADSAARGVVIMGIPYPPMMDPWIVLKKDFLGGQQCSKGSWKSQSSQDSWKSQSSQGSCNDVSKLDGESWYRGEAIKAVNQAIGRAIRHKDDFGAVILADQRFTSWNRDRFPAWIVQNFCSYTRFGEFSRSLAQFFKEKLPKQEFTAILPREIGFERNSSLREVEVEGKRKENVSSKKPKYEQKDETTVKFVTTYGSPLAATKPKVEQQQYVNFWEELEKGKQVIDEEPYAPYKPKDVPFMTPIDAPAKLTKIKIKREAAKDQIGSTSSTSGQPKKDVTPEMKEHGFTFLRMAKQRMKLEDYTNFVSLVKTYKVDSHFGPILTFLKGLRFSDHADVLKGFIPFVRSQHKTAYLNFLEKAENACT